MLCALITTEISRKLGLLLNLHFLSQSCLWKIPILIMNPERPSSFTDICIYAIIKIVLKIKTQKWFTIYNYVNRIRKKVYIERKKLCFFDEMHATYIIISTLTYTFLHCVYSILVKYSPSLTFFISYNNYIIHYPKQSIFVHMHISHWRLITLWST